MYLLAEHTISLTWHSVIWPKPYRITNSRYHFSFSRAIAWISVQSFNTVSHTKTLNYSPNLVRQIHDYTYLNFVWQLNTFICKKAHLIFEKHERYQYKNRRVIETKLKSFCSPGNNALRKYFNISDIIHVILRKKLQATLLLTLRWNGKLYRHWWRHKSSKKDVSPNRA